MSQFTVNLWINSHVTIRDTIEEDDFIIDAVFVGLIFVTVRKSENNREIMQLTFE